MSQLNDYENSKDGKDFYLLKILKKNLKMKEVLWLLNLETKSKECKKILNQKLAPQVLKNHPFQQTCLDTFQILFGHDNFIQRSHQISK